MTPKIQSTKNYSQFFDHGCQARLDLNHVKRLRASMRKNGFIVAKPLHCYKSGSKYILIDGHHRLEAATAEGIAVYYLVSKNPADADLIADENYAVRRWTNESFVNMFATKGYEDYIELLDYVERGLPLRLAISILSGQTGAAARNDKLQQGLWKIKDRTIADQIIKIINDLGEMCPTVKSQAFICSLSLLLHLPTFSLKTLKHRIEMNPRMLVKCSTRNQMLELLEEIYNFRASAANKVYLASDAQRFLQERKAKFLKGKLRHKGAA